MQPAMRKVNKVVTNDKPLSKCTDDEIESECSRRRAIRIKQKHKLKWCDECVHFRISDGKKEIPDNELMEACNLGHRTRFICPEHGTDDEWGFYRSPCSDREIAVNRKFPWQLEQEQEQERIEKHKQRNASLKKEIKRKEWNQKLLEFRLKKE